jgi:hypothetical protein
MEAIQMSKPPWTKFIQATGKLAELNQKVRKLAFQAVEAGFWPNHVVIGQDWLTEVDHRKIKSYWMGDFGIQATVQIVYGSAVRVEERENVLRDLTASEDEMFSIEANPNYVKKTGEA